MAIDTYETAPRLSPLEKYEWDDIWWDNAPDTVGKRILIIGDSISRGTRRAAGKLEGRSVFIDGIATSKAVDNPTFFNLLNYFAEAGHSYDAVFFNNGLHGWHLEEEKYAPLLTETAKFIKECFAPKKFFIVLTTPVRKSKQTEIFDDINPRVLVRNAAALETARELGAEVVDLYSLIEDRPELYIQDGVHLVDEGYILLAEEIIKAAK